MKASALPSFLRIDRFLRRDRHLSSISTWGRLVQEEKGVMIPAPGAPWVNCKPLPFQSRWGTFVKETPEGSHEGYRGSMRNTTGNGIPWRTSSSHAEAGWTSGARGALVGLTLHLVPFVLTTSGYEVCQNLGHPAGSFPCWGYGPSHLQLLYNRSQKVVLLQCGLVPCF